MKTHAAAPFLAALCLLSLSSACGGDVSAPSTPDDTSTTADGPAASTSTPTTDTATPSDAVPANEPATNNGLFNDCEDDSDCRSDQYCALGFCTAECTPPSGTHSDTCVTTSACGSGCCFAFAQEHPQDQAGACIPCADYFDEDGYVAGCGSSQHSEPPLGDLGDACKSNNDCGDTLQCIRSKCSDGCTSDSQCGSSQICSYNACKSVECKYDSDCGSCSRCSDHTCRDCGSGPYGCYC